MFSAEGQQLMVDCGRPALVPRAGEGQGRAARRSATIKLMKDDPAAVEKQADDIKTQYTKYFKV